MATVGSEQQVTRLLLQMGVWNLSASGPLSERFGATPSLLGYPATRVGPTCRALRSCNDPLGTMPEAGRALKVRRAVTTKV